MTLEMLLLNVFLLAQLLLSWVRAREVAHATFTILSRRIAWTMAIALTFIVPWTSSDAVDPLWLAVASVPFLAFTLTAHSMDPSYATASFRHRAFLLFAPAIMTSVSVGLASGYLRGLASEWPLGLIGSALLACFVGTYQSWRDFQNIGGMEPDDWKVVVTLTEERAPEKRLSDYEIWARIFLLCVMIVVLVLQVAAVRSATAQPGIWLWALLPAAAGLISAGATHRVRRDSVGHHLVPRAVYVLSGLSVLLCTLAVAIASSEMLQFSDLSGGAMVYRVFIGVLIGAMYAEDLLASFFLLNRLPVGIDEVVHAAASGIGFAIIFTCASTVSYYDGEGFRITWILFIGILLSVSYAASTVAWQGIGRQIPSTLLLTLKRPEEIAVADNSMFIALLGGCVAGASLLSNGQDPRIAGGIGGLIVAFILFAVGNDHQHLKNENVRLMAALSYADRSIDDRVISLKSLLQHLRFQEVVPGLVVTFSFLWAVALDWI